MAGSGGKYIFGVCKVGERGADCYPQGGKRCF